MADSVASRLATQRSDLAKGLIAAGTLPAAPAAMSMDHVPRRATQHGIFLSTSETPPTTLKPGQTELCRRGLYTTEAEEVPSTTYLDPDRPSKSEYNHGRKTRPEHYKNLDRWGPKNEDSSWSKTGASHWQSEYRTMARQTGEAPLEQRLAAKGALRTWPTRSMSVVSLREDNTTYRDNYGRYGSNPRDRLRMSDSKLPVFKTPLTAGTHKGSAHIPNYQGFIPANPSGPCSRRVAMGESLRSVDKTNLVDVFHRDLVGYAGHVATSFRNDFGGRQPSSLTVQGSDFAPPRAMF